MRTILLFCFLQIPMALFSQIQIEGRVFDATNNQPLVGASIKNVSGDGGITTDINGYFNWKPDSRIDVIEISFVGYELVKIVLGHQKYLNVGLIVSNTQLQEVEVSSFRNREKYMDSPASISLITLKDLRRSDGITITPSLNRVPSVYMHSGALNTNRITMRGIGSRSPFSTTKIRAYLNEIPLTTGTGETTIEDIDLGIIDRVEVIKGPSSSLYGAGLGGTINYRAKKASYNNSSFFLGTKIGSYGLLDLRAGIDHSTDRWNFAFVSSDLHSNGYRDNNQYDRRSYSFSGQAFTGRKGVLTLIGNWIDLKAFIPSSLDSTNYVDDPRSAAFTWQQVEGFEDYTKNLAGINYMHDLSQSWLLSASLFHSSRDAFELRPFNTLEEKTSAYGTRVFTGYVGEQSGLVSKFNIGFELFSENYNWQTLVNDSDTLLSDNSEDRKYYNIFGQLDLNLSSRTRLVLGINVNHTSYDYIDLFNPDSTNRSGTYSFENQWSPRIAITHKFNTNHTLYANISHGFSPPSLEETLTPDGQVNPDIQPESGYNFEIGNRGTLANKRMFYDVSVYTMLIDNLLVARRVQDDIFIGLNAGKTAHSGLDLTLTYNLILSHHSFWSSAQIFSTYMFADYKFKDFVDGENDYSGNDLTGTPPNKLNIGVDAAITFGFYGSLEYQFVDEMPMNDSNSAYSNNYSLLNFKFGFNNAIGVGWGGGDNFEIDINGGINNLLDEKYASMISINAPSFGGRAPRYYYPGLPRNYYGGLKLSYKFK